MFASLFLRVVSVFLLVFLGGLARRTNLLDAGSTTRLANAVKNYFYPALIFHALFNNFTSEGLIENMILPMGAFIIMAVGYFIGAASGRVIRFASAGEKSSFLFQCAVNNYSFLPLPIILMLWGDQGVAMLIFSTLGAEIAVWTFGVFALSGNKFQRESLKNLVSVPMVSILLAVLAIAARDFFGGSAVFANTFVSEAAGSFMYAVHLLGGAAIPVAMFVVGSRIFVLEGRHIFAMKQLYVAVLRLLIIPAAAVFILFQLPLSHEMRMVLIVVAVMPSANVSVVLSESYGADVDFAASSVLVTHIFALLTIPVWLSIFV